MSGGGSSKSTTQNYSPEEVAARKAVQDEAARIYGTQQGQVSEYPGARAVPLSNESLMGQDLTRYAAMQSLMGGQDLMRAQQFGLNGALDVNNNPYLAKAVQGAIRPITESYTDPGGVLATIRNNAVQNGTAGSTRQGIAEGIAAGRYANAVGDTTARMMSDAYGQGLDTFGRTMALAPQNIQALAQPGQLYSAIGAQNENISQEQEQYEAAAREWDINAPWQQLNNYANIIYGGGSSQSVAKTATPRQPLRGAAGGAMAGAMMGSVVPGIGTATGAVAGAILGALAS